jgi:predicted MPP superfamily phosphohydrolase
MRVIYWTIGLILTVMVLSIIQSLLLRFLNRDWWKINIIRKMSKGLFIPGVIGLGLWLLGHRYQMDMLGHIGALLTVFSTTLSMAMIITLPPAGLFNRLARIKKSENNNDLSKNKQIDKNRRIVLKSIAAGFPIAGVAMAAGGLTRAFSETELKIIQFKFNNLPSQLEGFRILHLSDSHLGIYKNLDDMEVLINDARDYNIDLALFSGDICDDLNILADVINITAQLKPKYGVYACPGNHEYYRGIKTVMDIFNKSVIPMLRSEGFQIDVDGTNLYVSAGDDPRIMGRDVSDFHRRTVAEALNGAPSDAFHILVAHRPESFIAAEENKIDLTLSGHTHGGQVGIGGRSFWKIFSPKSYLWGHYQKNNSQMYVSSGIGHWFPFRLGCPSEAPIIELKSIS